MMAHVGGAKSFKGLKRYKCPCKNWITILLSFDPIRRKRCSDPT